MSSPPPELVAWMPWAAAAFDRARAEARPVLLSLAADWCGACREMDGTSFADPEIAGTINARFVPIRVDADARPDIADRYGLGGWPTTAFLAPDGHLLAGGTFIERARMPGVLGRVLRAFESSGIAAAPAAPAADEACAPAGDVAAIVAASLAAWQSGDRPGPSFPPVAALRFAVARHRAGAPPADEACLVRALDALGWGGLFDPRHGGFFHYAAGPGWAAPHTAKRLDDNAALLRLYLEAGRALGLARFTTRAADVLAYVQATLADPDEGGWYAAQQAADAYYAGQDGPAPAVSRAMYADGNGAMVSAALQAARAFDDDGLRRFALASLERVLLACYRPGDGVAHDLRRACRGLLADHVALAGACLDAHDATGELPYEMMAEELMHAARRRLWDEAHGAFRDRAPDGPEDAIGLLASPIHPFAWNCDAAAVLRRLAASSGEPEFARCADRVLVTMAARAPQHGPAGAHYLLARDAEGQ